MPQLSGHTLTQPPSLPPLFFPPFPAARQRRAGSAVFFYFPAPLHLFFPPFSALGQKIAQSVERFYFFLSGDSELPFFSE